MYKEMPADMLIDRIYDEAQANIPDEVCKDCPLFEFLRQVRMTIKDMTHEQFMIELGVAFSNKEFPCMKNH